jgi:adenosine 3'-phospho 5'-phosphosulfate transporter B3
VCRCLYCVLIYIALDIVLGMELLDHVVVLFLLFQSASMLLVDFYIIFSIFVFLRYVWSGLLVVLGIFLNVYSKNMDKIRLPSLYHLINRSLEVRRSRTLAQTV